MLTPLVLFSALLVHGIAVQVGIDQSISIGTSENGRHIHHVRVGTGGNLAFEPNRLNANIGDQVVFEFSGLNHTLTQSSLEHPCTPTGQLDSGFSQFNPTSRTGLTLTLTVNTLEPQWFYCRQIDPSSHCHAGMVFALNPGGQMDEFLSNVKRASSTSTTTRDTMLTTTTAPRTTTAAIDIVAATDATAPAIITSPTVTTHAMITTSPTVIATPISHCQAVTDFISTTTDFSTTTVFLTAVGTLTPSTTTGPPTGTTGAIETGTAVQPSATQATYPRAFSSVASTTNVSRATGVYFGLFGIVATSVLLL